MDSTTEKSGSIRRWAWGISIGLHVVLLSVFAAITLNRAQAQSEIAVPQASVREVKALAEGEPVMPKPHFAEAPLERPRQSPQTWSLPADINLPQMTAPAQAGSIAELARKPATGNEIHAPMRNGAAAKVEFFGTYSSERKVVFVVDCSGSMKGLFTAVKRELLQSINGLEPDQYFSVIFFGGSRLIEFSKDKMVRANGKSKSALADFAATIKPSGFTDAASALRRAMQITDSRGNKAGTIYFLTDGFELSSESSKSFVDEIIQYRNHNARSTKINTIGFYTEDSDRPALEAIAARTGGQCTIIH
jgi:hypothetical protein